MKLEPVSDKVRTLLLKPSDDENEPLELFCKPLEVRVRNSEVRRIATLDTDTADRLVLCFKPTAKTIVSPIS